MAEFTKGQDVWIKAQYKAPGNFDTHNLKVSWFTSNGRYESLDVSADDIVATPPASTSDDTIIETTGDALTDDMEVWLWSFERQRYEWFRTPKYPYNVAHDQHVLARPYQRPKTPEEVIHPVLQSHAVGVPNDPHDSIIVGELLDALRSAGMLKEEA